MSELKEKLRQSLNPEQFEGATHVNGPAVIMAGAGSGKTHMLMNRVAYLIDNGVNANNILMLTFTNKAAKEMSDRAARLLDDRCKDITACTYHKFCNIMLHKYGHAIGLGEFSIVSSAEYSTLIDLVKKSTTVFQLLEKVRPKVFAEIFSFSINKQMDIKAVIESDAKFDSLIEVEDLVVTLKDMVDAEMRKEHKLNYDELLSFTNDLLNNDDIARRIAYHYKYIMIDEFQDTNNLQEEFVLKLARFNPNIVVVGDISQSIYGFRGANVRNLQNFSSKIPGTRTILLHRNYRSTSQILDAANEVMDEFGTSWQYFDMVSGINKTGSMPAVHVVSDSQAEAQCALALIKQYKSMGFAYKDTAVLIRNSMTSVFLEKELMKQRMPVVKRGGLKFFDKACVNDILSYMKLIRGEDKLALYRILQLRPGIGAGVAIKIANLVSDGILSFNDIPNNYNGIKKSELQKFVNEIKKLRNMTSFMGQVMEAVNFWHTVKYIAITGSSKSVDTKNEELDKLSNDLSDLDMLIELAKDYNSVGDFLDDIVLDSVSNQEPDDAVIISTVHSAKGLEWENVIILGCCEGQFPVGCADNDEEEEELRCFYVALTRAKRGLHLMVPERIMIKGKFTETTVSRFLLHVRHSVRIM